MDMNVLVTLLTITVILLSIVIIALLAAETVVLLKVNREVKSLDAITHNLASATDWLSPLKVVGEITKLFRK